MPERVMNADQALRFAFDWPAIPLLFKPKCNMCGQFVRADRALLHANMQHPGWLDEWNKALKEAGIEPSNP
jgi:hypothetical protein